MPDVSNIKSVEMSNFQSSILRAERPEREYKFSDVDESQDSASQSLSPKLGPKKLRKKSARSKNLATTKKKPFKKAPK